MWRGGVGIACLFPTLSSAGAKVVFLTGVWNLLLEDPVYISLFAMSWNGVTTATFSDVELIAEDMSSVLEWDLY